jgi:hypothetical protein
MTQAPNNQGNLGSVSNAGNLGLSFGLGGLFVGSMDLSTDHPLLGSTDTFLQDLYDLFTEVFYDDYSVTEDSVKRNQHCPRLHIDPGCILFHIPYNPLDPSRRCFQDLFRACLLQPGNEDPLPYLRNHQGVYCSLNRLIVTYHKQLNLKNLLFPRRFRQITGRPVSSFFPPLDAYDSTQTEQPPDH